MADRPDCEHLSRRRPSYNQRYDPFAAERMGRIAQDYVARRNGYASWEELQAALDAEKRIWDNVRDNGEIIGLGREDG